MRSAATAAMRKCRGRPSSKRGPAARTGKAELVPSTTRSCTRSRSTTTRTQLRTSFSSSLPHRGTAAQSVPGLCRCRRRRAPRR
jgi:hypothetical protein